MPRQEVLKFYKGEEAEKVYHDKRNQATKVCLHRLFTSAIELRNRSWKQVCLKQHFWETETCATLNLLFHFFVYFDQPVRWKALYFQQKSIK